MIRVLIAFHAFYFAFLASLSSRLIKGNGGEGKRESTNFPCLTRLSGFRVDIAFRVFYSWYLFVLAIWPIKRERETERENRIFFKYNKPNLIQLLHSVKYFEVRVDVFLYFLFLSLFLPFPLSCSISVYFLCIFPFD